MPLVLCTLNTLNTHLEYLSPLHPRTPCSHGGGICGAPGRTQGSRDTLPGRVGLCGEHPVAMAGVFMGRLVVPRVRVIPYLAG